MESGSCIHSSLGIRCRRRRRRRRRRPPGFLKGDNHTWLGRRITFPPSSSPSPPCVSTVNKKRKNEGGRERMSVLKARHANSRLVIYMRPPVPRLEGAVLNEKRARPPRHTYWYTERHGILPPLLKYSKPSRPIRPFFFPLSDVIEKGGLPGNSVNTSREA